MARFLTRPERLAAEREKKRGEIATGSTALNPQYPYRVRSWSPATFGARRVLVTDS